MSVARPKHGCWHLKHLPIPNFLDNECVHSFKQKKPEQAWLVQVLEKYTWLPAEHRITGFVDDDNDVLQIKWTFPSPLYLHGT
jgi:hypothetical protein